ncbi:MAG: TraB/GumN family protein [Kofleriaceae bacterium]|jgi:uncharacterized protein YbaP (TraB family)|nr:TraB/GumN family protein [Kofleriaceae bacterium]MBP9169221.1 TraB/GumN family protein [Kofleriaceae bacterium]MBP9859126.1 TraB/GumN family protein [Kofleriaceae bacterium]
MALVARRPLRGFAVLAIALVVVAVGCAGRPACPTLPVRPAGAPLVWTAQRGAATVWLVGTLHHLGADEVPEVAWAAVARGPRVATELGAGGPDPEVLAELARLPRGPGLDTLLPADDWYDLELYLSEVIRSAELRRARPWYALSMVTRRAAPGPSPSMDEAIAARAVAAGVAVDALESWREQLTAVDRAISIADLREALHARATMRCDAAAIAAAYRAGDDGELAIRLNVAGTGALLTDRNRRWLPAIEALADGGGGVIAVGVGHLLGADSLPALLTARGFTLTRVAR